MRRRDCLTIGAASIASCLALAGCTAPGEGEGGEEGEGGGGEEGEGGGGGEEGEDGGEGRIDSREVSEKASAAFGPPE